MIHKWHIIKLYKETGKIARKSVCHHSWQPTEQKERTDYGKLFFDFHTWIMACKLLPPKTSRCSKMLKTDFTQTIHFIYVSHSFIKWTENGLHRTELCMSFTELYCVRALLWFWMFHSHKKYKPQSKNRIVWGDWVLVTKLQENNTRVLCPQFLQKHKSCFGNLLLCPSQL